MASASSKIVSTTTRLSAPVSRRSLNVTCSACPRMTRVKQAGVAIVGAAILATSAPAFAVDLELGQDIFDGNCSACHAGGGNTVVPERTLEKDAIADGLEGGLNEAAIIYQVRNGKGAMPAWADRLDDDEIESVAAYVYKQASESLW